MSKSVFWTESRARLQFARKSGQKNFNWLFLPGGPGMGSESLLPLLKILKLPGSLWLLDLPGDGSNTTSDNSASFSRWAIALVEAARQFDHPVLVAHSTGGMYALSLPELEGLLKGLVLLDSAPNTKWQASFAESVRDFPVPGLNVLQEKYEKNPNNRILEELTLASAPYLFTGSGQAAGIETLRSLPYNYETCMWSEKYFDRIYQARWAPKAIPALILAGEKDLVTPLRFFLNEKRFNRENITFKSIKDAGHFPWIENPAEVAEAFCAFVNRLVE